MSMTAAHVRDSDSEMATLRPERAGGAEQTPRRCRLGTFVALLAASLVVACLLAWAGATVPVAKARPVEGQRVSVTRVISLQEADSENGTEPEAEPQEEEKEEEEEAKEKREPLDIPESPEAPILTPSELGQFHEDLPELPDVGDGQSEGSLPELSKMTGAEWTMVFKNTNLFRGLRSDDLAYSDEYLILPRNQEHWDDRFLFPEQTTHYEVFMTFDQHYEKAAHMATMDAFIGVASPFVAASVKYASINEHQSMHVGSSYSLVQKYLAPVASVRLGAGRFVQTEPGGKAPFSVNPEFNKAALGVIQAHSGSCKDLREEWARKIASRFGDIYGTKALVGVGASREIAKTVSSTQELEDAQETLGFAIQGNVPQYAISGEFGFTGGRKDTSESGEQHVAVSEKWQCYAGNTCDSDPTSAAKYRNDPNSWRRLEYKEFRPVMELLPKDTIEKFMAACAGKYGVKEKIGILGGFYYTGEMADGKPHGQGFKFYGEDGVYVGDFVRGHRTGKGKYTWPTGTVYEGDWDHDFRQGKGKQTWADGVVYEGDWFLGHRHGKGKQTMLDGEVYEGDWVYNKRKGKGKATLPDGKVYEGDFDDKPNGKGKITWTNGKVYEVHCTDGICDN